MNSQFIVSSLSSVSTYTAQSSTSFSQPAPPGKRSIFKISYNSECKRIPQEKFISLEDIIERSIKSFSLGKQVVYHLVHYETNSHIDKQEKLENFILKHPQVLSGGMKLEIVGGGSMEDLISTQETGQESQCEVKKQEHPPNLQIKHLMHPKILVDLFQELKKKGSINEQDVKLIKMRNASLVSEVEKVTNQESLEMLIECEQLVSEIGQQRSSHIQNKSDGEAFGWQTRSQTQLMQSSTSADLSELKNLTENKIKRLQKEISLEQSIQKSRMMGGGLTQRVNSRSSFQEFNGLKSIQMANAARARANSGFFETPGEDHFGNVRMSVPVFSRDQLMETQVKALPKEEIKHNVSDGEEDSISLPDNSIMIISERNESLEISLALNDSTVNFQK